MDHVIELRGVSKRYDRLDDRPRGLRSFLPFRRSTHHELWALRDLDLTLDEGESVGVIGHNGAGKTTLLRLLAGVTQPTHGRLRVVGRVAPLISLGVGFHQEMSGRENVMINGMLLGLTASQVEARFEQIVEFAEMADFIDTPVKFYSSGMFMRLGFSIVIHSDPTVLLIDEILAVGDAAFQLKCFDRLRSYRERGASIVMVSHSMHMIRQLCSRAVLIRHGNKEFDGDIEEAIARHYAYASEQAGRGGGEVADFAQCDLAGGEDGSHHASYGEDVRIQMRLRFHTPVPEAFLRLSVAGDLGTRVAGFRTRVNTPPQGFAAGDEVALNLAFTCHLGGGNYELIFELEDGSGAVLAHRDRILLFVAGRPAALGAVDLRATFAVDGEDLTDRRMTLLDA